MHLHFSWQRSFHGSSFQTREGSFSSMCVNWVPGAISIAVAVSVALAIRMARLRPAAITALGLVFESGWQLWHCSGRISAAGRARCRSALGRPVLGCRMDVDFQRGRADHAHYAVVAALASVTAVPAMVTAVDLVVPAGMAARRLGDLLQVWLSVLARRDHGLCRRPRGLHLGHRSDACS